ncbi:MAG: hypothetical protein QOG39_216 [Acidimicrobiaceae bacterium]
MARSLVEVEEVTGKAAYRRFVELAYLQLRDEPRWSAPLAAFEKARLDPHRNPFFEQGDAAYFLLRRLGAPAGRMTAQIAQDDAREGWFGFYDVVNDPAGTAALVDAAASWLRERGCTSLAGPASFAPTDDAGLLVAGFDVPGTTGRSWNPSWYADHLEAAGLERIAGSEQPTWRLSAGGAPGGDIEASADVERPALIGPYADPRLLLAGPAGEIAAVPDVTGAGSPWAMAKRAKKGGWDGCTVVRCDGDAAVLVPAVQAAAGLAGYRWVVAPWSPDPEAPPETVHARFMMGL